jgi:hypothetical protein
MSTTTEYKLATIADLCVVCIWSILGLTLTALVSTLGVGAEIGQLLALAG